MESIREIAQKIKQKFVVALAFPPTDLLIVAIIILVGFASFGLGRLSVRDVETPIKITESITGVTKIAAQSASIRDAVRNTALSSQGDVVASKNGSKYHFPWCGGAQRIAEKNLISFGSIEAARKAGYTPAANCKGLK